MESGGVKTDAPAVLPPEPEPIASAGGLAIDVKKDGDGDVAAPPAGLGYTPFEPAPLELPAVEYTPAGVRIHTSSWPPKHRDGPAWLIYGAFGTH